MHTKIKKYSNPRGAILSMDDIESVPESTDDDINLELDQLDVLEVYVQNNDVCWIRLQ